MLFTRCPDCETTFRITAEALRRADGQVRCGRCACVFNAYTELRRRSQNKTARDEPAADPALGSADTPVEDGAQAAGGAGYSASDLLAASERSAARAPSAADEQERAADEEERANFGGISLASVIADLKTSTAAGDPSDVQQSSTSDEKLQAGELPPGSVLLTRESRPAATRREEKSAPAWVILDERRARSSTARRWLIGCAAACALLALQATHHYRAQIAAVALIGPWVQKAYALLGTEVAPHWDLGQYEIVDWDAVAEPNASGQGNLKIAARIHNRGPRAQPHPHVQVQLKDRWESTVGSRIFAPSEYLPARTSGDRLMAAGQTLRAELDILDPGPDAYGFELDLCIDAEDGALRCAADDVFR